MLIAKWYKIGAEENVIQFVMEESAGNQEDVARKRRGLAFVVDPIDGTLIYAKKKSGYPFCVSVALEYKGEPIASAVYVADPSEYTAGATPDPRQAGLKGKIFWTEKGKGAAFRLIPPAGQGFAVAISGALDEIMNSQQGILELKDIPAVGVDIKNGIIARYDAGTKPQANAKMQLGEFMPDRKSNPIESGPVISAVRNAAGGQAATERLWSAVAGITRVVEGTASGYAFGCGFAWDHAPSLLLKEAGVHYKQYALPDDTAHTAIIAARDPALFSRMDTALLSASANGQPAVINPVAPERPYWADTTGRQVRAATNAR